VNGLNGPDNGFVGSRFIRNINHLQTPVLTWISTFQIRWSYQEKRSKNLSEFKQLSTLINQALDGKKRLGNK